MLSILFTTIHANIMRLHHVVGISWIYKENNSEQFNSPSASSALFNA